MNFNVLGHYFIVFFFFFKEMENDAGFQQAVRTSHGRRPPVRGRGRGRGEGVDDS